MHIVSKLVERRYGTSIILCVKGPIPACDGLRTPDAIPVRALVRNSANANGHSPSVDHAHCQVEPRSVSTALM
jgi:hypothetical protein